MLMEAGELTAEEGQPVPLQIYDIPYEGSGGDGDKTAVTRPELDSRPSTEYELPWEWKKEHIVKTLSGTSDMVISENKLGTKSGNTSKETVRKCLCTPEVPALLNS